MNPEPLTTGEWANTGYALKLLWISLLLAVVGAGSFLTAHAIIPSATDSGTLPRGVRKVRPLLYATGALTLVGIVIAVVFITGFLDFLDGVFPGRFR